MKKGRLKMSAVSLATLVAVLMTTISGLTATGIVSAKKSGILDNATVDRSIHESIDISKITNEGGNPPELLSAASALAKEKEWYEYVRYSVEPVGTYKINEYSRISFYDPYDYSNSLVMEVDDSITDWSSANSLTSTYETGNTLTIGLETSTSAESSVEVALGNDVSGSTSTSVSSSISKSRTDSYNESKSNETNWSSSHTDSSSKEFQWGLHETIGASIESATTVEVGFEAGLEVAKVTGGVSNTTTVGASAEFGSEQNWTNSSSTSDETSTGGSSGSSVDKGYSNSVEENQEQSSETTSTWSKVADRINKATGSSTAESKSWSTSDSHSISKTYNAQYFNGSGSPLQWKVIKYTVQMPMEYKVQFLVDDEWITSESGYCILNTIQGTCRSWIENNTPHYEHWGTGEAVVWNDFWSRFFTKDSLIAAYKNKLYPDR